MKFTQFISNLKTSVLGTKIKTAVSQSLYREDLSLVAQLREHSPVDTDPNTINSMVFRNNWKSKRLRFQGAANKALASIVITNTTPTYGEFVAFGATPGDAPWYYPHVKNTPTGKLTVSGGRVWAGGHSPGHEKTIGGAIAQVFGENSSKINKMTTKIADEFIKVFI